jgi:hypothetical protein
MPEKISAPQLEKALRGEFRTLVAEVVEAINQAQRGRIIADSEEPVRQATAVFRRRLYEKAVQLRQKQSEPAFSPSTRRVGPDVGEKGPPFD